MERTEIKKVDLCNNPQEVKEKRFKVIDSSLIPLKSLDGSAIAHNCSDIFMAKVLTVSGNERYYVVRYDFQNEKWISPISGMKEVIEYYMD